MGFGFTTARSAIPDARELSAALLAALDELVASSGIAPAKRALRKAVSKKALKARREGALSAVAQPLGRDGACHCAFRPSVATCLDRETPPIKFASRHGVWRVGLWPSTPSRSGCRDYPARRSSPFGVCASALLATSVERRSLDASPRANQLAPQART